MPDDLFNQGKTAFNQGEFFDAHEIWEELWQELRKDASNKKECKQLQSLIQSAVAIHLIQEKRLIGAKKVLARSEKNIQESAKLYRDIDLESLNQQIMSFLDNYEPDKYPDVKI